MISHISGRMNCTSSSTAEVICVSMCSPHQATKPAHRAASLTVGGDSSSFESASLGKTPSTTSLSRCGAAGALPRHHALSLSCRPVRIGGLSLLRTTWPQYCQRAFQQQRLPPSACRALREAARFLNRPLICMHLQVHYHASAHISGSTRNEGATYCTGDGTVTYEDSSTNSHEVANGFQSGFVAG